MQTSLKKAYEERVRGCMIEGHGLRDWMDLLKRETYKRKEKRKRFVELKYLSKIYRISLKCFYIQPMSIFIGPVESEAFLHWLNRKFVFSNFLPVAARTI